jgi:hypothetical protein
VTPQPDIKDRRQLTLALAGHLREAGFSWKEAHERAPRRQRRMPPLFTDLRLGSEPLQVYLSLPVPGPVDALADVYERFITVYLISKAYIAEPPQEWLKRALALPRQLGESHFVEAVFHTHRLSLHLNLMEFAALAAYNHPVDVEHGPTTFAVTSRRTGLRFGVKDGQMISNMRRRRQTIPVRSLLVKEGRLVDIPRGRPRSWGAPLFDVLHAWVDRQAGRLGGLASALHLGLEILWARTPPGSLPHELRMLGTYERSREALVDACKEARRYEQFDDPVSTLKQLFAPEFIPVSEFIELFGHPDRRVMRPVPEAVRQRWDRAIDALDPRIEIA